MCDAITLTNRSHVRSFRVGLSYARSCGFSQCSVSVQILATDRLSRGNRLQGDHSAEPRKEQSDVIKTNDRNEL